MLDSPVMALVVERLEKDEWDFKKEAAWCMANVLHGFRANPSLEAAQRINKL